MPADGPQCYVDSQGRRNCNHVHAGDLPANNGPGVVPDDYYEHLPGWTSQFQDRFDQRKSRFHEEMRSQGVEIVE